MSPLRSILRWVSNVVRDPALYVIAFTFYAGLHPRLTLARLALCYGATVAVIVISELWKARADGQSSPAADVARGVKWGSFLFVVGFAWGTACGYILMWMGRWGAGLEVFARLPGSLSPLPAIVGGDGFASVC